MSQLYQNLSHSKWDCKYHIVFTPKYCCKAMFGEIRKFLGPIFHELARQKEYLIIEGHLMPDPVHMCIENPPKYAVASIVIPSIIRNSVSITHSPKATSLGHAGVKPFATSSLDLPVRAQARIQQTGLHRERAKSFWSK
ncbi:IS200/IS605 family transposase [Leptolyngbya sp. FACHB-671]|nr:IS200/IS605 family transposase [Leptolyngbya sp. FACHB-671]